MGKTGSLNKEKAVRCWKKIIANKTDESKNHSKCLGGNILIEKKGERKYKRSKTLYLNIDSYF